jgi:adenylate cyclase, class 2
MPRSPHPTGLEIEIKLRVRGIPQLLARLKRIGAVPRGRVFERNTLFDTPAADFHRSGCLLRVRTETPAPAHSIRAGRAGAVLTLKAAPTKAAERRRATRLRYKERFERELPIHTPAAWPRILRSLGLRPAFIYEKYRSTFVLGRLHLDLDETPAGVYLELEGAPSAIDRAAKALGYSSSDYLTGTYWDVYAADCRRRGVKPANFLFRGQKSA